MRTKIKGIYVMSANKNLASEEQHSKLVGSGLQSLVNTDKYFNILWDQARSDKPKFHESTKQIERQNQPLAVIVANFKEWLKNSGVRVDKNRWDSYFFQLTTPDPTALNWKQYVLVYFDASGVVLFEYSKFIVDYTVAARNGDAVTLTRLLTGAVNCPACEKVVDPAVRANNKGFLECPFCGQFWTKPMK